MRAPDSGDSSEWSGLPVRRRGDVIRCLVMQIARRQQEIARTVAAETGKPVTEVANQEVTAALEMLRYSASMAPRWLAPEKFRYLRPGFWAKSNAIHFESLGTILIIGPSNFPFSLPVMQAGTALLCGNRVILKPSERCPRTAALIEELLVAADIPAGTVDVVHGGPDAAQRLIERPDVRKVIFTGSSDGGRSVAEACGRAFKPCVLELGGCSPAIVCRDADLSLTARGIAWSAFYANGDSCVGTKRVYVHGAVRRRFTELLEQELARIKKGDPADPATELGTGAGGMEGQLIELLRDAAGKGAEIRGPAGMPLNPESASAGHPLVVLNASPEMRIMREDVRGPVLCIREVTNEDQAVCEANQCGSGLGASVWSASLGRARTLAGKIQAGMVWVNDSSAGLPQFPWGGVKESGWGRMFSRYGMLELMSVKVISAERQWLSGSKMWWFPYSRRKQEIFSAVNDWYGGRRRMNTLARLLLAFLRRNR